MVPAAVATAAPVEVLPRPVLASWLLARLRAVSAATAAALLVAAVFGPETVPATALVPWTPPTPPADVLT
jgi:hypothetical protein